MHKNTKKRKALWRSIAVLVLTVCMVLPMVPQADAAALNVKMGKVSMYEYNWINTYEELMAFANQYGGGVGGSWDGDATADGGGASGGWDDGTSSDGTSGNYSWGDVLLAWEDSGNDDNWQNGKLWYAKSPTMENGESAFDPMPSGTGERLNVMADPSWYFGTDPKTGVSGKFSANAETFFTDEKLGYMQISYAGSYNSSDKDAHLAWRADGTQAKSPEFMIRFIDENGKPWYITRHYTVVGVNGAWTVDLTTGFGTMWEEELPFTIRLLNDPEEVNSEDYGYGDVHIYYYVGSMNMDYYFRQGEEEDGRTNTVYIEEYYSRLDADRAMRLYACTEKTFDVLMDDVTVSNGQTFRIDEEVMADDNITITVKDGGVMVVNELLINNGKIVVEEGGTLIVEEGAHIAPMYMEKGNTWGNKITLDGGNMIVHENAKVLSGGESAGISIVRGGSLINRGKVYTRSLYLNEAAYLLNEKSGKLTVGVTFDENLFASVVRENEIPQEDMMWSWGSSMQVYGRSQLLNRGKVTVPSDSFYALNFYRSEKSVIANEDGGTVKGVFDYIISGGEGFFMVGDKVKEVKNAWPEYEKATSGGSIFGDYLGGAADADDAEDENTDAEDENTESEDTSEESTTEKNYIGNGGSGIPGIIGFIIPGLSVLKK